MRAAPAALSVLWWMVVAEIAVRAAPLPRVAGRFGVPIATGEVPPGGGAIGVDVAGSPAGRLVLDTGERRRLRALELVGPRWPFGGGPCLRQALVAGHVLRRRGPVLRIGAALQGSSVVGHAWVEVAGTAIGYSPDFEVLRDDRP